MKNQLTEEVLQYRKAEHDIHPQFLNRWSSRSFEQKEIGKDELIRVFEAARWAPSSNNEQPWRFIIARTPEQKAKFYPFMTPSNQEWCEEAPVLAAVVSKKITSSGNAYRTHAFDAGASWAYLALQAEHQGLVAHPMGGFNQELARAALRVPDDFEIQIIIALGYRGTPESLNERNKAREHPSGRRPLSELLFEGGFNQDLDS